DPARDRAHGRRGAGRGASHRVVRGGVPRRAAPLPALPGRGHHAYAVAGRRPRRRPLDGRDRPRLRAARRMSGEHLISRLRGGFPAGHTAITREGEARLDTGVDFGINRFREGESLAEAHPKETAWLLLDGEAEVEWPSESARVRRTSLFDEPPTALHVPGGTRVSIRTRDRGSEWAVVRATNERRFAAKLFRPEELKPEYRGQGLVQGTSLRNVRLIF